MGSNHWPPRCQRGALANWATPPYKTLFSVYNKLKISVRIVIIFNKKSNKNLPILSIAYFYVIVKLTVGFFKFFRLFSPFWNSRLFNCLFFRRGGGGIIIDLVFFYAIVHKLLFFAINDFYLNTVVVTAFRAYLVRSFKFVALRAFNQVSRMSLIIGSESLVSSLFGNFSFWCCHYTLPLNHYSIWWPQSASLRFWPHTGQSPLQSSRHKTEYGISVIISSFINLVKFILSLS